MYQGPGYIIIIKDAVPYASEAAMCRAVWCFVLSYVSSGGLW
jgi:hypothetical protein